MISKPSNVFLRLILLFSIYYMCFLQEPYQAGSTLLLEENKLIALKTYQPQFGYWSHQGLNNGIINDPANHYYLRKGLSGDYSISLESKVNKGFYWRVKDGKLKLEPYDGTEQFKEESSFIPVPGLEDFNLLSLRPVKYPKHYVRHYRGRIEISTCSNNDVFYKDATWFVYWV